MPANEGGESAEQTSRSTPLSNTIKNSLKVIGGGTVMTALIASWVFPLVIAIVGIIVIGILAVVSMVVLKNDGQGTSFDRLMCLLGLMFGRPVARFLPAKITDRSPAPPASAIPLQVSPPVAIKGQSTSESPQDDAV